jgi:hypothetical protein
MRASLALVGFFGIMSLPSWVVLVCIVLLSIRYRAWEVILMGACMDLVWLPAGTLVHTPPLFTIASIVIVWGFEPLRAQFLMSE